MFTLCPIILPNSGISSIILFLIFSYEIMPSANKEFYLFLSNLHAFHLFFLLALARHSNTMLNRSGENGYSHLVPGLGEENFQSFTIKYGVSSGFSIDGLRQIEEITFCS